MAKFLNGPWFFTEACTLLLMDVTRPENFSKDGLSIVPISNFFSMLNIGGLLDKITSINLSLLIDVSDEQIMS